jgi:hypothetical protein
MNGLLERLDIKPADADLIRNVGTVVTQDVVRSLMFSIHVQDVKESHDCWAHGMRDGNAYGRSFNRLASAVKPS